MRTKDNRLYIHITPLVAGDNHNHGLVSSLVCIANTKYIFVGYLDLTSVPHYQINVIVWG